MPSAVPTPLSCFIMPERFVHACRVIDLPPASEAADLADLKKRLPSKQARRMSGLGVLIAHVLADLPITRDSAIIYATTYTESRALEAYLASFPYASPTHFQTSIHPGGIEQALILNQQPVAALYPLAGRQDLLSQALSLACLEQRPDVFVIAGEESGTWLTEAGVASERSFAFALHLSTQPSSALATLRLTPDAGPSATPKLPDFTSCLTTREDMAWHSPFGSFVWQWTPN
jgi:hypothetical protein